MRIVVQGRVQGVGFRDATLRQGRRLGLRGWVKNRQDGAVEILAEGGHAPVAELVAWCANGPAAARVTAVDTNDVSTGSPLSEFAIRW